MASAWLCRRLLTLPEVSAASIRVRLLPRQRATLFAVANRNRRTAAVVGSASALSTALLPPPTTSTCLPANSLGSSKRYATFGNSSPGTSSFCGEPRTPSAKSTFAARRVAPPEDWQGRSRCGVLRHANRRGRCQARRGVPPAHAREPARTSPGAARRAAEAPIADLLVALEVLALGLQRGCDHQLGAVELRDVLVAARRHRRAQRRPSG